MRKKILSTMLALTMVISLISVNAYAVSENGAMVDLTKIFNPKDSNEEITIHMDGINFDETIIVSSSELSKSSIITPMSSHIVVSEDLTSSTGSQDFTWDTTSNMRYYRIFIENTSSVKYKLTGSAGTYDIPANDWIIVYTTTAASVGRKKVTVSSNDGSKLKGNIAVRLAETLAEVKP